MPVHGTYLHLRAHAALAEECGVEDTLIAENGAIIELNGGPLSVASLRALRFGGRFCIVGWAATPFVARGRGKRGAPNANQLPTNLIQMKGLDVLGCPAVISLKHEPGLRPTRLKWILARIADGTLRPHVGPAYPLADFAEAMRAKWSSRFVGGCVLHP